MEIVKAKDVVFEYIRRDEEGNVEGITTAVDHVSMNIEQGDFIAILGHNGSGKSTLAKHINAILYPTEGTVWVDGMDTTEETGSGISGRQPGWCSRTRTTRLSDRLWKRMWDSDRKIWESPQRKSGSG